MNYLYITKSIMMPKKLDRCVKSVMKQGKSESSAYAICNAAIGKLKPNQSKPKSSKR